MAEQPIYGSRFLREVLQAALQHSEKGISGALELGDAFEGPPGHVHGGVSAALLDEAMGMAVWSAGYPVVLVNLNTSYEAPLPLHRLISVQARLLRVEGRKVFAEGALLLPDGKAAVRGTGIFVQAPQLFPADSAFMQRILGQGD